MASKSKIIQNPITYFMDSPLIIIGAVFVLWLAVLFIYRRFNASRNGNSESHLRKASFSRCDKANFASRKLLNQSEKHFFRILAEALPDYYIFPQVSFNALITHSSWIRHLRWKHFVRQQFNTKYVDFVLCRKSDLEVVSIVEYDGNGHIGHNDEQRDYLLACTGYRIERFKDTVSVDCIKTRFDDLLPTPTKPQEIAPSGSNFFRAGAPLQIMTQ